MVGHIGRAPPPGRERKAMSAKYRVEITLTAGTQIRFDAADITLETDDGEIRRFEWVCSEGPQLAYVRRSEIAAIVVSALSDRQ
jgi:hypothetical protein